MIKVFEEDDRLTVVFPKTSEEAFGVIEEIIAKAYNGEEALEKFKVDNLVSTQMPDEKGVKFINNKRPKKYQRLDDIRHDSRNPFPGMNVFEALNNFGLKSFSEYLTIKFSDRKYDEQIKREMFSDLLRYLVSYTDDKIVGMDVEICKKEIVVLSHFTSKSVNSILRLSAYANLQAFLESATEQQLKSAERALVKAMIEILRKN